MAFVYRQVTSHYGRGNHTSAWTILDQQGGADYLEEATKALTPQDSVTSFMVAMLSFVWWKTTDDQNARIRATDLWSAIDCEGELRIHAIHMLGCIVLEDKDSTRAEIRLRISQLTVARQQNSDAEYAKRLAAMALQLGELYFRRCKEDR